MNLFNWQQPFTDARPATVNLNFGSSCRHATPNFRYAQQNSYVDNAHGVSDTFRREINVSPRKCDLKEIREVTVHSPSKPKQRHCAKYGTIQKKIPYQPRKQIAKAVYDNAPRSAKLDLEIFLENINGMICLTKVRREGLVRWQNVKKQYWDLFRHHPALTSKKTVKSAAKKLVKYKKLLVTLTKTEVSSYKPGQLVEGVKRAKPKKQEQPRYVNVHYRQSNTYICNSAPSTSREDRYENDDYYSDEYSTESDDASSYYSDEYN